MLMLVVPVLMHALHKAKQHCKHMLAYCKAERAGGVGYGAAFGQFANVAVRSRGKKLHQLKLLCVLQQRSVNVAEYNLLVRYHFRRNLIRRGICKLRPGCGGFYNCPLLIVHRHGNKYLHLICSSVSKFSYSTRASVSPCAGAVGPAKSRLPVSSARAMPSIFLP